MLRASNSSPSGGHLVPSAQVWAPRALLSGPTANANQQFSFLWSYQRVSVFFNFLDKISVEKVMRSSMLALSTLLAAARASAEVRKLLWVYVGPSWPTFICEPTPKLFTFKKILCTRDCLLAVHACASTQGAQIFFPLHPWYLLHNHTNFCKHRTSKSRDMMGYKLLAHLCLLCAPTNNFNQLGRPIFTFAENLLWWSDFIWQRYWDVLPGSHFLLHRTNTQINTHYSNLI